MKLLDYIKGSRKGKDAHRIEREAMEDQFLSDALEGYDAVQGDHPDRIARMQQEVTRQSRSRSNHWKVWSVAASILLCISIGGYFLMRSPQPDLYSDSGLKAKKTEAPPISPEEPVLDQQQISDQQPDEVQKRAKVKPSEIVESQPSLKQRKEEAELEIVDASKDLQVTKEVPANIPVSSERFFSIDTASLDRLSLDIRKEDRTARTESPQAVFSDQVAVPKTSKSLSLGTIRGKIVDSHGEPLAGASVIQKGSTLGTVTDVDGLFVLKTDEKKPLIANFIGYESKEFAIDTTSQLLIAMNEDVRMLDEVVVVAYGTQKKSSVTGSISTVSSKSSTKPQPLIGMKNFEQYLKDALVRPSDDLCADKKGTVELQFNVNAQGRPYNIVVKKSVCSSLDNEAIRLLNEGCDWSQGDETVKMKVRFK